MLIDGDSNEKSLLKANSIATKLINAPGDNSNYHHLQIYNQTINDKKMNSISQYQLSNNLNQNVNPTLLNNNQTTTLNRLNLNQNNHALGTQLGTLRPHNQQLPTQLNGACLTPLQNNIISNYATISRAAHINGHLNGQLNGQLTVPNLTSSTINHYQQLTPLNTQINQLSQFQLANGIYGGSSPYLQQQLPHQFPTIVGLEYPNQSASCCLNGRCNITRVIAFICGLVVLFLMSIGIGTSNWLTADKYRQGLFQFCVDEGAELPLPFDLNVQPGFCYPNRDLDYIRLSAILCCFGFIFNLLATLMTGIGLCSNNSYRKYALYKVALYIMIGSLIMILAALVIYPAWFASEIETSNRQVWEFGYSYGLSWGSCIFLIGGILLLLCDRESEHFYYRERTIIHNPNHSGVREAKA